MGLFKKIFRSVKRIARDVVSVAAPVISAVAPIAFPGIGGLLAGFLPQPSPAGGSQAVVAARGIVPPQCNAPGVLGGRFSPIFNAALNPPFNPATLPARPFFGQQQILRQQFQAQTVPFAQTTSFNQGAFGASVGPSFRPFAPSFRSGQVGVSGAFTPGLSRGLAPQLFGFGGF